MSSSPTDIGKSETFVQGTTRLVQAGDDDEEKMDMHGVGVTAAIWMNS